MNKKEQTISEDIRALAKKFVSDKDISWAIKEVPFKEFIRICLLMKRAAVLSKGGGEFTYSFVLKNARTNEMVNVKFDTKMTVNPVQ